MKTKVYYVTFKDSDRRDIGYYVDAPNKYVARWCAVNMYNYSYMEFASVKDMIAKRVSAVHPDQNTTLLIHR